MPGQKPEEEALRVLIAHSDQDLCKAVDEILAREGLTGRVCNDGHQALQALTEHPPHVAVIDVALPGVFAFELIDQIRRHPKLQDLRIILLSSVYNKTAYKRSPSSLYGADDYIEKHHIPDDLVPKIHRLIGHARTPAGEIRAKTDVLIGQTGSCPEDDLDFFEAMNNKIQQAEEREISLDPDSEARVKARRLANILVSDIALYNQERVDEGLRNGKFFELLASEIAEGKRLFNERFPPGEGDSDQVLREAFETFMQRRREELGL